MIVNLRNAKSHLSEYVQRAAKGEEIVITVRGQPTAKLLAVKPLKGHRHSKKEWMQELEVEAEKASTELSQNTEQAFWDELREER